MDLLGWLGVVWGVSLLVVAILYWESAHRSRKRAP